MKEALQLLLKARELLINSQAEQDEAWMDAYYALLVEIDRYCQKEYDLMTDVLCQLNELRPGY